MTKRKFKKYQTIDSSEIQEDSFVKFKNITLDEILEHTQGVDGNPNTEEAAQISKRIIDSMIVDWDWEDDEGNPLPIPAENLGTVGKLPFQESSWLISQSGVEKLLDQKN